MSLGPSTATRLKTEIRPGIWAFVTVSIGERVGEDDSSPGHPEFRQPTFLEVHAAIRNLECGECSDFDDPKSCL